MTVSSRISNILSNFLHYLSSNILSFLISIFVILGVPKLLGVEQYAFWQLYLLYLVYAGMLQLGWCDGIYLRYGGKEYASLDYSNLKSQLVYSALFGVLFSLVLYMSLGLCSFEVNKSVLAYAFLSAIITTPRGVLFYTLQATNRIKTYSKVIFIDRISFAICTIILLLLGYRSFHVLVFSDLVGKVIAFIIAAFYCKEIVRSKLSSLREGISEALINITVGIKLMLANIASSLIIGTVRMGIERGWDIATFGKVSLTLSISNMLMIFINAVGVVIYPILRRTDTSRLPHIYMHLRSFTMLVLLFVLLAYYPLKEILEFWLPQYSDSLHYMAMLFPICVFEGRMALLVNTYLKTLRLEKLMLKINLAILFLSLFTTTLFVFVFKNLDLLILSIPCLIALRCITAELILSRKLEISLWRDTAIELCMTVIFICSSWFLDSWFVPFIYLCAYLIYLFFKRNQILSMIDFIKTMRGK